MYVLSLNHGRSFRASIRAAKDSGAGPEGYGVGGGQGDPGGGLRGQASEVDEKIENRSQAGGKIPREDGLWPQELWVG